MNKRPLNGEPEEDEDDSVPGEKKPVPPRAFMSWQDALVLLVIVGLCVGGYKYYQYSKQKSADTFAKCAQLYDAKNWLEAENCYDSTWKLSYVTASLDSLRSLRLGLIQDMRNAQLDVYEAVDAYWNDGDSVKAIAEMEKLVLPFLLDEEKYDVWKKWEVIAAIRNAAVPQQ